MTDSHGRTWIMGRNTEKREKCETHTLGPGIGQETLKNEENQKCTLQDLDYGEKTEKFLKNDIHTLQNLKYGKKTDK